MRSDYQEVVYKHRLEEALEYQDYICLQLHHKGIIMQNMGSKKYQMNGENMLGLEIKHDLRLHGEDGNRATGNLYIETHEKADPSRPYFVKSGIYREDNSWLYGVGDYSVFYVFPKNILIRVDQKKDSPLWLVRRENDTSKGFTMPESVADGLAALVIKFDKTITPANKKGASDETGQD